mgnify:CR=1 FL=1
MLAWGLDLGGTKIEAVVVDPNNPAKPIARKRIPTEAERGYQIIVENCARLINKTTEETDLPHPEFVGVGAPGAPDPSTGKMRNCNTVCLNGQPLPTDLQAVLNCDCRVTNDANCFALAEAKLGCAQDAHSVFGVILGTGVGGGIVINGEIVEGANGIAGEWGHIVGDPSGPKCYCGKIGCVETLISGPALEKRFEGQTGQKMSLQEIAASNSPEEREVIDYLCHQFGQSLAQVVNVLDPEVIVLGGGVGQIPDLYQQGKQSLLRNVFHSDPKISLRKPLLGDSAGVFGAAMLTKR